MYRWFDIFQVEGKSRRISSTDKKTVKIIDIQEHRLENSLSLIDENDRVSWVNTLKEMDGFSHMNTDILAMAIMILTRGDIRDLGVSAETMRRDAFNVFSHHVNGIIAEFYATSDNKPVDSIRKDIFRYLYFIVNFIISKR